MIEPSDRDLLHRWFVQAWDGTENLRGDTHTSSTTKVEITWGRCLRQKYEGEGVEGVVERREEDVRVWRSTSSVYDKQHHVRAKRNNALGID